MQTRENRMFFCAAYHQDARNKAAHFIGVPRIEFSLMIPLGWLRVDAGMRARTRNPEPPARER